MIDILPIVMVFIAGIATSGLKLNYTEVGLVIAFLAACLKLLAYLYSPSSLVFELESSRPISCRNGSSDSSLGLLLPELQASNYL